jgi:hypothetical protein
MRLYDTMMKGETLGATTGRCYHDSLQRTFMELIYRFSVMAMMEPRRIQGDGESKDRGEQERGEQDMVIYGNYGKKETCRRGSLTGEDVAAGRFSNIQAARLEL